MSIPLSLYIHIPWCIRKCPYCDFNSHKAGEVLPEMQYINALVNDLVIDLERFPKREVQSIFFGGGTPSLLDPQSYQLLFEKLQNILPFAKDIEITLEANPGTIEQQRFADFRALGINRLSLGVQSFNDKHLKTLGRIHDATASQKAIEVARDVGFTNLNIDLMYALPQQTVSDALYDINLATSFKPEHISWYQLTIEPNTYFYKKPPTLPNDEVIKEIEEEGYATLNAHSYLRYEISAFAANNNFSQHNMNYWLFGDYFGIGAGAHGKLTIDNEVWRTRKCRMPADYLKKDKPYLTEAKKLAPQEILFEFMLNVTRLEQKITYNLFTQRTGLGIDVLMPKLEQAMLRGLVIIEEGGWRLSRLGRQFTNDLQIIFME